jgi:hypothetical protein
MIKLIKNNFPFLTTATFHGGSTSTLGSYEGNLKWEKQYINRKVEESKLPFQEKVKNGIKRRVFNEGVDDHELKWHFDERDRKVKVVKSDGWSLQMDNGLPTKLNEGDITTIPKGVYHRVIKGQGSPYRYVFIDIGDGGILAKAEKIQGYFVGTWADRPDIEGIQRIIKQKKDIENNQELELKIRLEESKYG